MPPLAVVAAPSPIRTKVKTCMATDAKTGAGCMCMYI